MAAAVFALVAIVVFGTALFVHFRRERAKNFYTTVERWRKTIGLIALAAIAWTFIRSGRPELILIALVSISLATIYVLVERPDEALA